MLLEHLREQARAAHRNTSFSPEKRGDAMIVEFSELLESDLEQINDEQAKEAYKEKFISLFRSWLSRKANCFSVMITGGSNFPVRRHQKANASEQKGYETFKNWRNYRMNKLTRVYKPKGIDAELEQARTKLNHHQQRHDFMKSVNAVVNKKNAVELLSDMGIKDSDIVALLNPSYSYEKKGFQTYHLTNNLANLKRYEERVITLEGKFLNREKQKDGELNLNWDFSLNGYTGKVFVNYEDDRIQITINEGKPDEKTRDYLKRDCALNWSPTNQAWQRKITQNAFYCIKRSLPKQ